MSSNSTDCSLGPMPNPDVSGIGVRISFYAQAFLLALQSARSSSSDEITNALTTLVATNMAYCVTTMTLGFAGNSPNQLSLYDALVVVYLLTPSWTAIFFTMPAYNRLKKGSRVVKLLAILQSYLVFACAFVVLTLAPSFGSNPPCNGYLNFVIFRPFKVLENGRTAFLVLLSCVTVGYTLMLVSDYRHGIGIFMKAAREWNGDEEKGRRRKRKGEKSKEMKGGVNAAGSGEGGEKGGAANGDANGDAGASGGVRNGDATTGQPDGGAGDTGSQAAAGDGQPTTGLDHSAAQANSGAPPQHAEPSVPPDGSQVHVASDADPIDPASVPPTAPTQPQAVSQSPQDNGASTTAQSSSPPNAVPSNQPIPQNSPTVPSQPSPPQQASNPPPSPPTSIPASAPIPATTPIPRPASLHSSRSSPDHLELTLFNPNPYSTRLSFQDSTANESTISFDKEAGASNPDFGGGAFRPGGAGIDPTAASPFGVGARIPADLPYQVDLSGRLIVNIFLISVVSLLAILNTELLREYNHPQPADKSWGFGQILPVFLVILPLTSTISAFKEHGLGERKRKHKKVRVRNRKTGAAGIGTGTGASQPSSAPFGGPRPHRRRPTAASGGAGAGAGGPFFGGAGANPFAFAFGGAPFSGAATGTTNAAGTTTMFATGAVIEEVSEMGHGRPEGDGDGYEVYEVDSDDDDDEDELYGPEEAELDSHGIQQVPR
ncbi:hypothetical protein JAAARDRAFT_60674 [Jaapia argillacea MUCL 33604]|uniref:Uncharacterized protein n=1 Tax=Jaapia argillacea MUCL 33604 TaxID=933084 RepID=A0A067PH63_9AGAM|nr:hypothetical protein JAAARDRAFT_60674 [Jaapia argillacea MUCL 33604]